MKCRACVKLAEDKGCSLSQLTAADLKTVDERFGDDVTKVFDFQMSAEVRLSATR